MSHSPREQVCRVNQAIEDLLIGLQGPMWIATIALGALHMDARFRVIWPFGLMAAVGAILGYGRRREGRDKASKAQRDTAVAELILQAVLATRSQPSETGLRLVAHESTGSESAPELPSDRRSAR